MTQGKASRDVNESQKREPRSRAIDPGAVSRLGNMVGVGTPYKTLQKDDGTLEAPTKKLTTHDCGSQGRH